MLALQGKTGIEFEQSSKFKFPMNASPEMTEMPEMGDGEPEMPDATPMSPPRDVGKLPGPRVDENDANVEKKIILFFFLHEALGL